MTDTLLATAIANWEPRFTANGVDASDYRRITQSLDSWDAWCDAWCDAAEVHLTIGRSAELAGHALSAGESFARAATYFHFAKFLFVQDPGRARAAAERGVAALTHALPLLDPPGRRVEVAFDGSTLVGVLRTPRGDGPHPTVLLICGLDSAKEELRDVERAFLDRGMATFALDGPGQGEAEWTLALRPDWDVVGAAVLDALASQPEVDASWVGVWGVSLGGLYAARLAASDLPVRATISLSTPYNLGEIWDRLNPLTQRAFEVRSYSPGPDAARARARDLTLEGFAGRITTPLLVIAGRLDRLFPADDAERLAHEAGGECELLMLEDGNHGCANVVYRHRPYGADWMAERLVGARA
ncbi:MAG: alpha/beta hydrolase family protein [Acidimicrobiales bacterium]